MQIKNNLTIVGITTKASDEAKLSEYYQASFLPNLLEVIPEITSAKRYINVEGDLAKTLTLYTLQQDAALEEVIHAINSRPGREEQRKWWATVATPMVVKFERPAVLQQLEVANNPQNLFDNKPLLIVSLDLEVQQTDAQTVVDEVLRKAPNITNYVSYTSPENKSYLFFESDAVELKLPNKVKVTHYKPLFSCS